jgi:hypothetical protein
LKEYSIIGDGKMSSEKYYFAEEILVKLRDNDKEQTKKTVGEIIGEHQNAPKNASCVICGSHGMVRLNAQGNVSVGLNCCRNKFPKQLQFDGYVNCAKGCGLKQGRRNHNLAKAWGICRDCMSRNRELSIEKEINASLKKVRGIIHQLNKTDNNYLIKANIYIKTGLEIPYTIANEKYEYANEIVVQLWKSISVEFGQNPSLHHEDKQLIEEEINAALKKIDGEKAALGKSHEKNLNKASVYIKAGFEEPFAIAIINGMDEDEVLALWEAEWRKQYEDDDILLVAVLQGHLSQEQAQWINTVRSDHERLALACIIKPERIEWAKQLMECGFDKSPEAVEDLLNGASPKIIARVRGVEVDYDILPPTLMDPLELTKTTKKSQKKRDSDSSRLGDDEDNWNCPNCQSLNFLSLSKCSACGVSRERWDGNE